MKKNNEKDTWKVGWGERETNDSTLLYPQNARQHREAGAVERGHHGQASFPIGAVFEVFKTPKTNKRPGTQPSTRGVEEKKTERR